MSWQLLYWPVAVVLMALGQGLLLPAIRRTVPGPEARRQSFALHYVLTAAYFLPLVLQFGTVEMLRQAVTAVLSRVLLFDPVLNYFAGSAVFAVGSTARTDKALRWLAARLNWKPETLRLVVWVVSLVAASLVASHFSG